MKTRLKIFLITLVCTISVTVKAQLKDQDFSTEQLQFTFMSSDGSNWQKCTHTKKDQPHSWVVACAGYQFKLHLFLRQSARSDESTFELNYWADEVALLNETHTHSTWITVNQVAQAKRLVSYLGFTKDTNQLRLEVNLH